MSDRPLVVFDMDDTLCLERDYVLSGFSAVGEHLKSTHQLDNFYEIAAAHFNEGRRGNIFNSALDELQFAYELEFIQSLVDIYRNHRPNIQLLPKVSDLLILLKNRNIALALITDGYSIAQNNKIAALELSKYIEKIIVTDDLGGPEFWKPSPIPYQIAADHFNIPHGKHCFYIGDNPTKDFTSPHKLGWTNIRITHEHGLSANKADSGVEDYKVSSIDELTTLLVNLI